MPINWFNKYTEKFRKPFRAINKKIHVPTGTEFPGGDVQKGPAGEKPSPTFRQIGKTPEDKSGFPVKHLGDNK